MDSVLDRFSKLLDLALKNRPAVDPDIQKVQSLKQRIEKFANSKEKKQIDQWTVNAAIHTNEWANFVRQDFEGFVSTIKDLFGCFQCTNVVRG